MYYERKEKLLKYLFWNEEMRDFLCNDFFVELSYVIKYTDCISSKNIGNLERSKNLKKVKNQIIKFLNDNIDYRDKIFEIYIKQELSQIIDELTIGFVFYLSQTRFRFNNIDIFRNKRSICYSPISVIDIF